MSTTVLDAPVKGPTFRGVGVRRRLADYTATVLVTLSVLVALVPLAWVLVTVIAKGLPALLSATWFTHSLSGLTASSSHVSLAALREKPDAIVEACSTLGFTDLFMPAVPPDQRDMAADGWRSLGRELGETSEQRDAIAARPLQVLEHHQDRLGLPAEHRFDRAHQARGRARQR